jgi:DNA primase
LLGTHISSEVFGKLRTFQRVYLTLDQDDAGIDATLRIAEQLGTAAIPVALPDGAKDVSDLASDPDGHAVFASTLLHATGAPALNAGLLEDHRTESVQAA